MSHLSANGDYHWSVEFNGGWAQTFYGVGVAPDWDIYARGDGNSGNVDWDPFDGTDHQQLDGLIWKMKYPLLP